MFDVVATYCTWHGNARGERHRHRVAIGLLGRVEIARKKLVRGGHDLATPSVQAEGPQGQSISSTLGAPTKPRCLVWTTFDMRKQAERLPCTPPCRRRVGH